MAVLDLESEFLNILSRALFISQGYKGHKFEQKVLAEFFPM